MTGPKVVLLKANRYSMPELGGSTGVVVCHEIKIADRFLARLVGLLKKRRLEPGTGLLIEPCSSIHTFGMAFPIDVVTLDHDYRVLGIWKDLRPWRVKLFSGDTRRVLELASGSLRQIDLEVGDYLQVET